MQDDKILTLFLQKMRQQLGVHLKEIILFGSRARGDFCPDSDYNCLAVVNELSPAIKDTLHEISGDILYHHNELFAIIPVSEADYQGKPYEPLFMNIRREGVIL